MHPDPSASASRLELRILGPVQAVRGGRGLAVGGPKPGAVLAMLLLEAGRVVPAGQLIEELWRGRPPPGAAVTLRSYVSRLRALLAPDAVLVARGGGYGIDVAPGQVDASRFERLTGAGQAALGRGEAAVAASRFGEALALWRGPALADVADVERLALEAARLEELRLVAVEGRIEAELGLGLHAEVAGELERLVAEHPLRERLWRLLVLALYRCERQADALAAYRRARAMLAGELGLEPGEELRRLEQAVLRHDVPAVPRRSERHNLPAQLTSFLGREQDLAQLEQLLAGTRLLTLTGPGGVGKTRLARKLAAVAADRFPDGTWLTSLAGLADPALVASQVMEALGVRQGGEARVTDALLFRLRDAGLLLVLDNCEHLLDACAELAGTLLRGSPGLRVLATSREPLGVPGEVVFAVPPLAVPAEPADAEAIAGAPAVRLFLDRGSAARGGVAPAAASIQAVARICRELDGLPLAIELAAARASALSVEEIERHLQDLFRFLAYRRPAADPRHQALKAAIDWSYQLLSEPERRVLGELSVFAGGFSLDAAAAVCCGGDQAAALDAVDALAAKSLVVAEVNQVTTRYRLLETIRQYAAGRLAEAGFQSSEPGCGTPPRSCASPSGSLTCPLWRASTTTSAPRSAGHFPAAMRSGRGWPGRWAGSGWRAASSRKGWAGWSAHWPVPRPTGACGPTCCACSERCCARPVTSRAQAVLTEGLGIAAAAGLPSAHARIRVALAQVQGAQGGSLGDAQEEFASAVATHESEGDLEGQAEAWLAVGMHRFFLGDSPAGEEALERAAVYARRSGNRPAELLAKGWLALTFVALRTPADVAIGRVEHLLAEVSGEGWTEAGILSPLALLYAYAGRFADARAAMARCQSMSIGFGARLEWAVDTAHSAAQIELIAGNPAAAGRELRPSCQALHEMGERGYLATALVYLAEALYAQGQYGEAQRLTEEAEAMTAPDDIDSQARRRATRAKLLARDGQFPAARRGGTGRRGPHLRHPAGRPCWPRYCWPGPRSPGSPEHRTRPPAA